MVTFNDNENKHDVYWVFMCHKQVADSGPILDMMGVVLENIPTATAAARATIYAVHQTAKIASSLPNKSYYKKVRHYLATGQYIIQMTMDDNNMLMFSSGLP